MLVTAQLPDYEGLLALGAYQFSTALLFDPTVADSGSCKSAARVRQASWSCPVSAVVCCADGSKKDAEGKHPLECAWTLWFDPGSGKNNTQTWGQTLMPVYSFETVEDFWW